MENPEFLKKKYDLHNTLEVKSASFRTLKRTGEKVSQNPKDQIQNYLDRFSEIIERKDPKNKEMGMEVLKRIIYDKFVIKPEEIPESYFENQRQIAREQGHGDVEITDEMRAELIEVAIADQKSSLDTWVDYLSSEDATYPDWLKYWAFRNVLTMGAYDKEKKVFTTRTKGTVKPFPDLNREALAMVLDTVEKKYKTQTEEEKKREQDRIAKKEAHLTEEEKTQKQKDREDFQKILAGENFAKLYAWQIDKNSPASVEQLANTNGIWVKYNQGDDHMPLVESLQGHATGWCTAGESTAKTQLENGNFYVFYSEDREGDTVIPRAAIRMQGDKIAEVRGIAEQQNLDSYIAPVVQEKVREFPDGKNYEKKSADMKFLTEIEKKVKNDIDLNKTDLVFLYEIDSKIQGFGYNDDPRIAQIRNNRNKEEDAPIVFECTKEQIAHDANEINENTKAYIGPLEPGIFDKLSNLENVYTEFPEKRIRQLELKQDIEYPKTKSEYLEAYSKNDIKLEDESIKEMLGKMESSNLPENQKFIILTVADLGYPSGTTYENICKKGQELGLELCAQDDGPKIRLSYDDQPSGDYFRTAMKSIELSSGKHRVWYVIRNGDGVRNLRWRDGDAEFHYFDDSKFVFRARK